VTRNTYRVSMVCPVVPAHGRVYDWPGERWSFYCANQEHDGWGDRPPTRAFFTAKEVEQGCLDGSQLPIGAADVVAATEAVVARQGTVLTGRLNHPTKVGSGADARAGAQVQPDREARRTRSGSLGPQAMAASADPVRRAGGRSLTAGGAS